MRGIILLVLVLLLSPVDAQEIIDYKAKIEVTDLALKQEILLSINNTHASKIEEFTYPFSDNVQELSIRDSEGELMSSLTPKGDRKHITFSFRHPLEPNEVQTISIKFVSKGQVSEYSRGLLKGSTYTLITAHFILANVKNFELAIAIPEGYGIVEDKISPSGVGKGSDGRRIILKWEYKYPIPPVFGEFRAIVLYEPLYSYYFLYIIIIIAALLVLAYVYRYLREEGISLADFLDRKKYLIDKIEILKEDEQTILKLIVEKDGIDQREIQRKTDFSKTKVSKILSELEKRGNIRKEPYGRRNKIFLTDKIK